MMTDEEMAAAIAAALEPLAHFAEVQATLLGKQEIFNHRYDETHLALMKVLDKCFDAGIKYGMHVNQDEHFLLHGGRYES